MLYDSDSGKENQRCSFGQLQAAFAAPLPVLTPWSVSLAPGRMSRWRLTSRPFRQLNLQEAALWYWQEPQRRAALAELPAEGQEREVDLLRDDEDMKEPVRRWVGVPLWASLAVFAASAVLTTPFSYWAMPGNSDPFQWFDFSPSVAAGLALSLVGLGVLFAFANRRGWFFKAGALLLIIGVVLQGIPYFAATFTFPDLNYDAAYPYAPYDSFFLQRRCTLVLPFFWWCLG